MSWYVQTLLKNSHIIRGRIFSDSNNNYIETSRETLLATAVPLEDDINIVSYVDFNNDDYNNLLLVEKTLDSLTENKRISDKESIIISSIITYGNFATLERRLKMSRLTIAKIFSNVCDRIAFILGYEFTDAGYLDYMKDKYNLTLEQIELARTFMLSNKR